MQIDQYAQSDLKKGLQLFGTEGNIGLTNAWSIVQTDVSIQAGAFQFYIYALLYAHTDPHVPHIKILLCLNNEIQCHC